MHNGERRNPLANVPRNKYVPFVLVRGLVGQRKNGKRMVGEKRSITCERRRASRDEWRLDEYSVVVVVVVVVGFKTAKTTNGVFARHNPLP